jgi:hypothetical protein
MALNGISGRLVSSFKEEFDAKAGRIKKPVSGLRVKVTAPLERWSLFADKVRGLLPTHEKRQEVIDDLWEPHNHAYKRIEDIVGPEKLHPKMYVLGDFELTNVILRTGFEMRDRFMDSMRQQGKRLGKVEYIDLQYGAILAAGIEKYRALYHEGVATSLDEEILNEDRKKADTVRCSLLLMCGLTPGLQKACDADGLKNRRLQAVTQATAVITRIDALRQLLWAVPFLEKMEQGDWKK